MLVQVVQYMYCHEPKLKGYGKLLDNIAIDIWIIKLDEIKLSCMYNPSEDLNLH
jgi:hypothetical protein